MKRAVLRRVAEQDIEKAFSYYLGESGPKLAVDFVDAVDDSLRHIETYPASGSQRYVDFLGEDGLRSWVMTRFPYVLIYIEYEDYVDVLRVLHQQMDIPTQLESEV